VKSKTCLRSCDVRESHPTSLLSLRNMSINIDGVTPSVSVRIEGAGQRPMRSGVVPIC